METSLFLISLLISVRPAIKFSSSMHIGKNKYASDLTFGSFCESQAEDVRRCRSRWLQYSLDLNSFLTEDSSYLHFSCPHPCLCFEITSIHEGNYVEKVSDNKVPAMPDISFLDESKSVADMKIEVIYI